jgi:hypothetical protein
MPKTKKCNIDGGTITNFYDVMGDKFTPKIKNVNKHLHGLDLPFRMLVTSFSGGGKTNLICNLIQLFCHGEGTFQQIIICTKNKDEPLYNFLKSKSKEILIKEGLAGNLPKLDETEDKDEQKLIILDDLLLEKNLAPVENYFIRCRKFGWSIIFITQSYYRVPKTIRLNINYLAILKIGSKRDTNMILSEVGVGVTKEQLMNMFEYSTRKPLDVFLIHIEKRPSERYHHNLLNCLNPEMFYEEVMGV